MTKLITKQTVCEQFETYKKSLLQYVETNKKLTKFQNEMIMRHIKDINHIHEAVLRETTP